MLNGVVPVRFRIDVCSLACALLFSCYGSRAFEAAVGGSGAIAFRENPVIALSPPCPSSAINSR
jgi:hypothetical protein